MKNIEEEREQFIKAIREIVELENPDITDRVYRMTIARMKLYLSYDAIDALIWIIRDLISTHHNPKLVFDQAPYIHNEYEEEMKLLQIIFENALEMRYKQIEKQKDRK